MNSKMMIAGALVALVAISSSANAYHNSPAVGPNGGFSPETWTTPIGVAFPVSDPTGPTGPLAVICATLAAVPTVHDLLCGPDGIFGFRSGDILFGFTVCEQNDLSDEVIGGLALTGVTAPGFGGICNASAGFVQSGATCVFTGAANEGRSTGLAPDYNTANAGVCPNPNALTFTGYPVVDAAHYGRQWYTIKLWDGTSSVNPPVHAGTAVVFSAQLGGVNCNAAPTNQVTYDDQFAYTVSGGHISLFSQTSPAVGTFGTYTVASAAAAAGTSCGTYPFYQ